MDVEELAKERAECGRLAEERGHVSRTIEVIRADLARADMKAQVVTVAVVALLLAVANRPELTMWSIVAGVAGLLAVVASLGALWPTVRRSWSPPLLELPEGRVEREQWLLDQRKQEVADVHRLEVRKFRRVQLAYVATLVAVMSASIAFLNG